MASLMEDLITVLDREESEYQKMLELSTRKTPSIVSGDLKQLEIITDEEQIIVSNIKQLEQKRENTINDIANVLNKDVEELKLATLIQMLEDRPAEQKKLALVHDRLQDTMSRMVRINNQNRELINNALELVEFDLNFMQAMRKAPETANYNKEAFTSGDVIGDKTGRFDAKQ